MAFFISVLTSIGLVGNSLAFCVLFAPIYSRKSYSYYLRTLAVFDSLTLIITGMSILNGNNSIHCKSIVYQAVFWKVTPTQESNASVKWLLWHLNWCLEPTYFMNSKPHFRCPDLRLKHILTFAKTSSHCTTTFLVARHFPHSNYVLIWKKSRIFRTSAINVYNKVTVTKFWVYV